MTNPKTCPKHDEPLVRVGKAWHCKSCLYAAHLTHEAQKNAQKRWRDSEKGKQKIREHETGKGKAARERYLKSPKYKARRKEYNERLKESLAIARAVRKEATHFEPEFTKQKISALMRDIHDYMSWGRAPSIAEVTEWAEGYNLQLTEDQVRELIIETRERQGGKQ